MTFHLTSQTREFLDGWLALAMPWVIWSAFRYLRRRRRYYDEFYVFYRSNKMAISVLVLFVGLEGRTVISWILRHYMNFGYAPPSWLQPITEPILTLSSVLAVVGALCWGRVAGDMPMTRPWAWAMMAAAFVGSAWIAGMIP